MNKILCAILITAITASVISCKNKSAEKFSLKRIDTHFMDSVIKNSDSSYTKNYKRADFFTADYYISKKDSSTAQIMRDIAKQIRQVIISRNNIRTYFSQYYDNGQIIAHLSLDPFGQYHGHAVYYYRTGNIKSRGNYNHGLSTGTWQEFNNEGADTKLKYDSTGVRILP